MHGRAWTVGQPSQQPSARQVPKLNKGSPRPLLSEVLLLSLLLSLHRFNRRSCCSSSSCAVQQARREGALYSLPNKEIQRVLTSTTSSITTIIDRIDLVPSYSCHTSLEQSTQRGLRSSCNTATTSNILYYHSFGAASCVWTSALHPVTPSNLLWVNPAASHRAATAFTYIISSPACWRHLIQSIGSYAIQSPSSVRAAGIFNHRNSGFDIETVVAPRQQYSTAVAFEQ